MIFNPWRVKKMPYFVQLAFFFSYEVCFHLRFFQFCQLFPSHKSTCLFQKFFFVPRNLSSHFPLLSNISPFARSGSNLLYCFQIQHFFICFGIVKEERKEKHSLKKCYKTVSLNKKAFNVNENKSYSVKLCLTVIKAICINSILSK